MSKTVFIKIAILAFISALIISLFPKPSFCEIQTITHTVKQPFGGSQSADDARISAIAKAKREALEMAGVYVEALTIVKDAKVDKDEILALAAGVLKTGSRSSCKTEPIWRNSIRPEKRKRNC